MTEPSTNRIAEIRRLFAEGYYYGDAVGDLLAALDAAQGQVECLIEKNGQLTDEISRECAEYAELESQLDERKRHPKSQPNVDLSTECGFVNQLAAERHNVEACKQTILRWESDWTAERARADALEASNLRFERIVRELTEACATERAARQQAEQERDGLAAELCQLRADTSALLEKAAQYNTQIEQERDAAREALRGVIHYDVGAWERACALLAQEKGER